MPIIGTASGEHALRHWQWSMGIRTLRAGLFAMMCRLYYLFLRNLCFIVQVLNRSKNTSYLKEIKCPSKVHSSGWLRYSLQRARTLQTRTGTPQSPRPDRTGPRPKPKVQFRGLYEFIFHWKIKCSSSYMVVSSAHMILCFSLCLYLLLLLTCLLLCPASNSCWIFGIMYLFKITNINISPPHFGLLVCTCKTKNVQVLWPDSWYASVRLLLHVNIQEICFFEPALRKGYDYFMHLSSWRWEELQVTNLKVKKTVKEQHARPMRD